MNKETDWLALCFIALFIVFYVLELLLVQLIKNNMENETVEMFDIYAKVDSGGEMIQFGTGKHLKLVARIVNGQVLVLEEDYFLEKRPLPIISVRLITNSPL